MKIGTWKCWLFGHVFIGRDIVYEPHYLKAVESGVAGILTNLDYHFDRKPIDFCVRCGIKSSQ